MSTKKKSTARETMIIDKGELGAIGVDLTEPDWGAIEKEVALLSPKGYHGERSRLDPDKIIAQAQHLAELYRQYGKPIPDGLAVLI